MNALQSAVFAMFRGTFARTRRLAKEDFLGQGRLRMPKCGATRGVGGCTGSWYSQTSPDMDAGVCRRCYTRPGARGGALAVRRLVLEVVDAGGFVLSPQRGVRGSRSVALGGRAMRVRTTATNGRLGG